MIEQAKTTWPDVLIPVVLVALCTVVVGMVARGKPTCYRVDAAGTLQVIPDDPPADEVYAPITSQD